MTSRIYGITYTDPFVFDRTMKQVEPNWLLSIAPISSNKNKVYYGFLNLKDFIVSYNYIQSNAVAVVFDTIERLVEIEPIVIMDNNNRQITKLIETIRSFDYINAKKTTPVFQTNDYIRTIINTMKSDAFLHTYNTFFYRIPKEIRLVVKELVLSYMTGQMLKEHFDARMEKCFQNRVRGVDPVKQIFELVNSPQGEALKSAVNEVLTKKADPDEIADRSIVSAYEIRYMLSFLNPKKDKRI